MADNQLTYIEKELEYLEGNKDFRSAFSKLKMLMYETAVEKGWHEPSKSFGEQILMMHTELSEIVEAYREEDGDVLKIWQGSDNKPEGVPIEFADLVIRVLDTCDMYGIDLLSAIFMKAKFNLTRLQRHGNKKL